MSVNFLVKFKVSTPEMAKKIEVLQQKLDFNVTSKVAEYCVENYSALDTRVSKLERENQRLKDIITSLGDAVRAKNAADEEIQILLGEKL